MSKKFFGVYRGVVQSNRDPLGLGRLEVLVPAVSPMSLGWALPCASYGGADGLGTLADPPMGANVWVQFEEGSADVPIWIGTFWGTSQKPPPQPLEANSKILKTEMFELRIDDDEANPKLEIRTSWGAGLSLDRDGVTLENGLGASIVLTGPKVSLNQDALAVI